MKNIFKIIITILLLAPLGVSAQVTAPAGGTGLNSYTAGDLIYAATTNPLRFTRLLVGLEGECLTVSGGLPAWLTCASGGSGTPAGSDTYIQINSGGGFGADADFTYATSTNTLTAGRLTAVVDTSVSLTAAYGSFSIRAGHEYLGSGAGKHVLIYGGNATNLSDNNGGNVYLIQGTPDGAGTAGNIFFTKSDGTTDLDLDIDKLTADRKQSFPDHSGDIVVATSSIMTGYYVATSTTATSTFGGQVELLSTNAGGDNTSDSTKRITLTSYQKAQTPNNFGESIRIMLASSTAKGMIAWYNATSSTPELKAWAGYHYGPNDASDTLNPHDHFSIETNDASGIIRTRFEIDAANQDTTQVNTFNSNFTVIQGVNGVSGVDGLAKPFSIYTAGDNRDKTLRWSLQGNATSESGSNVGTDFQISSFADNGNFIATPFFIKRSDGRVGIGTTSPQARLNLRETTDIPVFHLENTTGAGNTAAAALIETRTSSSRAIQAKVFGDSISRYSLEASGQIEWGAGGVTARDTNLYRNAASVLRTDDTFVTTQIGVGIATPTAGVDIVTAANPATDPTSATNYQAVLRNTSTATGSTTGIGFHVSSGTGVTGNITYVRQGASSFGDMTFGTTPSGGTVTERMRILSGGKVGIGTTSPYAKLSVVGETVASHFTATTTATSTLPVFYSATSTISNLNGVLVVDGVKYAKTGAGIQQALNECANTSSCSKVFLTSGTHPVSTTILVPSSITLEGSGYDTLLYLNDNVDESIITNNATTTGNSNIQIRNIRFDGNDANQTDQIDLISFRYISDSVIENNWVENSKWSHIAIEGGTRVIVRKNYITGGNGHGVVFSRIPGEPVGTIDSVVESNVIHNVGVDGGITFAVSPVYAYGVYLYTGSQKNIVTNNIITDVNGFGITLSLLGGTGASTTDNIVSDNQIKNAGMINTGTRDHSGIYLGSVERNTIINNDIASSSVYGINLVNSVENRVENNKIYSNQQDGILSTNSNYSSILNNRIYNNGQLTPNTYSAIRLGHTGAGRNSGYNVIRGNYIYDNQIVKTQKHGIRETNTSAAPNQESNYNDISFNYIKDTLDVALVSSGVNNQVIANTGATTTGMLIGVGTNVGIGTTSPYARLSVTNSESSDSFVVEDQSSSDTSRFVIDNSGNVGIQMQTPLEEFHVNGQAIIGDTASGVYLGNVTAALSSSASVLVGRSNGAGSGIFATAGHLILQPRGSATLRDIYFLDGGGAENMVIKDGGAVGIGTSTPGTALGVTGAGVFTGQVTGTAFSATSTTATSTFLGGLVSDTDSLVVDYSSGNVGIGDTSPENKLNVIGSIAARETDDGNLGVRLLVDAASGAVNIYRVGGLQHNISGDGATVFNETGIDRDTRIEGDNDQNLLFIDAGVDRVGVGTSSPASKLSVVGSSYFAGAIYATSTVTMTALTGATGGTNQDVCINTAGVLINETTGTCVVSSKRFKENIEPLNLSGLDLIRRLNTVSYSPKSDDVADYGNLQYGFIAEEVADIDPHLAKYGTDGLPRTLDDRALLAVAFKAIQEISDVKGMTRSAEENWQNILIALFIGYIAWNEYGKRKKKNN